jgi:hypothetical protein
MVDNIANLDIENKIIPLKYQMDAIHIAIATFYGLDKIVSLNYQHIVKNKTKAFAQQINIVYGYNFIDIYTPMDLIKEVIDNEKSQCK